MRILPSSFAVWCLVAGGLLTGCEGPGRTDQPLLLFPPPPGTPRVQFLTWASGPEQVEAAKSSFEEFILGSDAAQRRGIDKPYGVAARDGVVYVCDTKGLCIGRLDFKEQRYSVFGASGPGRLRKPLNMAIDPLGYKFVVDSGRKQVVVFGPDDRYVTAFDVPTPCKPVDVALYGNEVYVLDNDETCQIVVVERTTGEVLRTFGGPGGKPGQFKIPGSLCIDSAGFLYVSDTHNWRIQKLTREGEPVWVKGEPGYQLGVFGRPRGIRVGPEGIVYVVDGATAIVQMFDTDGNVLMRFGGPGKIPGALELPASLAIDPTSVPYFREYVHPDFKVDYLMFVSDQYGSRLVNVYAFGSFPEGYQLSDTSIAELPKMTIDQAIGEGLGPVEGPEPDPTSNPAHPPLSGSAPAPAGPE